ncbi:hypothetical protein ANN_11405 [Periplaneta americana]|uniref:Uncharacterized protein n=1 Tax=Periplaneta americana TaxID=6978 RepID=A0ABQ8T4X3_PERAM|nr:hypothetical protein ANN_11405 [Periplaneta americana]
MLSASQTSGFNAPNYVRKWGWLGHTLRRPPDDPARKALDWNLQGSRGIGRPKIPWKRTVLTEAKTMWKTWSEIKDWPGIESDGEAF